MNTANPVNENPSAKPDKLEVAYLAIRERIISGEFPSGYALIVNTLALTLGLSTMPVREALRRLESEGWVTSTKNRSAHVTSFSDQQWLEHMQILAVLEGYAVALAAPNITQEDIVELRQTNESLLQAIASADFLEAAHKIAAFHGVLYSRCPNTKLREDIQAHQERLAVMRQPANTFFFPESSAAAEQHEQIILLLESRASASSIEQLAREHKLRAITALREESLGL